MGGLVYCHDCFRSFDPATPLCPQCGAARTRIENGSVTDGAGHLLTVCIDRYVLCRGRAARKEFWRFSIVTMLIGFGADLVDAGWVDGSPILGAVSGLVFLVPAVSMAVRRLHDLDLSGRWLWIILVPLAGVVMLMIWDISRGTEGANRFGPDPRAA